MRGFLLLLSHSNTFNSETMPDPPVLHFHGKKKKVSLVRCGSLLDCIDS